MAIKERVIKPYYRYKQEAFNKVRRLIVGILKDNGIFDEYSFLSEDMPFLIRNVASESGSYERISYYLNGIKVCTSWEDMFYITYKPSAKHYLTKREYSILKNNMEILFKADSKDSVYQFFNSDKIPYWSITKDDCEFVSMEGQRFINRK
jgi:hypothetical protein